MLTSPNSHNNSVANARSPSTNSNSNYSPLLHSQTNVFSPNSPQQPIDIAALLLLCEHSEPHPTSRNTIASTSTSSTPRHFKQQEQALADLPPLLQGCIIAVSTSFDEKSKRSVLLNCIRLGADVRSNYDSTCTHLITLYQIGEDYHRACTEGKIVVSAHWLDDCILTKQYLMPFKRSLHYPLQSPNGIAGMHNLIISVTGFVGEDRNDLKYLIKAAGAKYSGALSRSQNTHLICLVPEGDKYRKALEWNIKVVTRRWLEDCILFWERQPEALYRDIGVSR